MACYNGWPDIARLLIAADGSVEHLRMKDMVGGIARTALDCAANDEIKALLTAAEAAAQAEKKGGKGGCICM